MKDETRNPLKKHLRITVSEHPEDPFGPAGSAFSTNWVEGLSAVQLGDEFFIYFNHYAKPQHCGVVKSRDRENWQDVSDRVEFPLAARHGTVLKVPEEFIRRVEISTRKR